MGEHPDLQNDIDKAIEEQEPDEEEYYNEFKAGQGFKGPYPPGPYRPGGFLTSSDFKDRLADYGIKVTNQTIRNWDKKGYISFQKYGKKGFIVFKNEAHMDKCIHHLVEQGILNAIPDQEVLPEHDPDVFEV